MKAALARAAGRISSSDGLDQEPHVCIDCGKPLESWQTSRCTACVNKSLDETVITNSQQWQAREEHPVITQYTRRLARIAANNEQWEKWENENPTESPTVNRVQCGEAYCDTCALRDHSDDCDAYNAFLESEGERLAPKDYVCNGKY